MNFFKTEIPEIIIIQPNVLGDERGYFFESFKQCEFEENIQKIKFIQDNESKSRRGVLRGLHFQKPPFSQAKLVRCIKGKVIDIAVDIRIGSPTYGKHIAVELSEKNKRQLFIPRGFAHGFAVLSEEAIVSYKVDNNYAPDYESGIKWDDKQLKINWKLNSEEVILSEKDKDLLSFKDFKSPFNY
ncbi:dTDP-4-dehydrorhamnose 3,5-epimerase [Tenacibaculum aiptasiae]|uniref:dTDP-4-dehydrorhamnose 3,5-epimerase n=1 Tax=Tenacibaculum aiptasiae TaxID=426481 RepID=A0A7J5A6X6_9FLAO|nr:dTDP-4-dehydrorhamnose 3,5-epimerase [Tenacibaculum aiptasiae]KAB1153285.1 dTDP-4-dehydrorhamnose 3,5-epimerase [Tenacibaculum aiptasiae]